MRQVLFYVLWIGILSEAKRKLKVLVNSPNVGYSHLQFQGRLADALVNVGHEVVSLAERNCNDFSSIFLSQCGMRLTIGMERGSLNEFSDTRPLLLRYIMKSSG